MVINHLLNGMILQVGRLGSQVFPNSNLGVQIQVNSFETSCLAIGGEFQHEFHHY